MSEYKIHNGTLYDYNAGCFCGVLVTENVMRKMVRMQAIHLENVKRLLADEAERGNVHASSWTLHYPNGEQTTVRYIDTDVDLQRRIELAVTGNQPRAEPLVFIASSMAEAKRMADARYDALNIEGVA